MSRVYTCDRCKKEVPTEFHLQKLCILDNDNKVITGGFIEDLCESCVKTTLDENKRKQKNDK